MNARVRIAALVTLLCTWPLSGSYTAVAWAQAIVRTQISAEQIEVGQELTVRIQGDSADSTLDNPRLRVPPSFVVNGPSVGTQKKISIVNGQMESSTGTTATWVLTPTKAGTFEIGPGTFNDNGRAVTGDVARIQVVARGTLPKQPRQRSGFPFDDDPFSGFRRPGSIFDDLFRREAPPPTPPAPLEYQVDRAPDKTAFLRATLTPATGVVGEQMTLRVYAYGSRGPFEERTAKEARHPDFFAYPITGNSLKQRYYSVPIDDREYLGVKVREIALFPLKAGELDIGAMTMSFYGRGYQTNRTPEGIERTSKPLTALVREPPAAQRPDSYQLGDVGDFTLRAEVSPSQVEAGGAISVVAELRGTGRMPGRLLMPEGKGMDWLEPSLRDDLKVSGEGQLGGSRTFSYLVRLSDPGKMELGDLTLPYYSPSKRRYEVARARLGQVVVRPTASTAAPAPTSNRQRIGDGYQARAKRWGQPEREWSPAEEPWFYPGLLLPPLAVLLLRASSNALATARRRRAAKTKDPAELARQALTEATREIGRGNLTEGVPLLERALFLRLEASTGLKGRAVLLSELGAIAERSGVPAETAELLAQVLGECQQARFGSKGIEGKDLLARASRCNKALLRVRPSARADG